MAKQVGYIDSEFLKGERRRKETTEDQIANGYVIADTRHHSDAFAGLTGSKWRAAERRGLEIDK